MVSSRLGREIPAGKDAAGLFPWWRTGMALLGSGAGVNTAFPRFAFAPGGLIPGQQREPWLRNDQPGPVAITEVRFWSNQPFCLDPPGEAVADFLDFMVVQMETDLLQGLVKEWMPVKALHTEEDVLFFGQQWAGVFKLPAPFYVQAQEQFGIRINALRAWTANERIRVQVRGKDPLQGIPTSYDLTLTLPPLVGGLNPHYLDYPLVDNRDAPIRDNLITDIAFANDTIVPGVGWGALDGVEVKFLPPTGPEWTKDQFTHLHQGLFEQVGMMLVVGEVPAPAFRRPVIHRPKRPYILRPGDSFRVEAMFDGDPLPKSSYTDGENIIYCRISGVQEGTNA